MAERCSACLEPMAPARERHYGGLHQSNVLTRDVGYRTEFGFVPQSSSWVTLSDSDGCSRIYQGVEAILDRIGVLVYDD